MKIKDILFDGKDVEGEVGIEIEVEGENLPNVNSTYWHTEQDGSLRAQEAYEYVLKKPVPRDSIDKSLKNLQGYWDKKESKINDSFRAGVHIHINVRDMTIKQVITFSMLYYLYEEVLLKWCGEDRVGNHFCLSSKDAEYVLFALEKAIVEDDLYMLDTDEIRYSSLNYKALVNYGSLEFRGMRSTSDMNEISSWAKILLSLKDYAMEMDSPTNVIECVSMDGAEALARKIFKEMPLDIKEDWGELAYSGVRRIQSIAFCVDWTKERVKYINIPVDMEIEEEEPEKVEEPKEEVFFDLDMMVGAAPPPAPAVKPRKKAPNPDRNWVKFHKQIH